MNNAYRQGFMDKMAEYGMSKSARKEERKDRSFRNVLTELIGPTTSVGVSTASGVLGAKMLLPLLTRGKVKAKMTPADKKALKNLRENILIGGAGAGLLAGTGANMLGGTLAPLLTRRRTKKEQYEHDSTGNALKSLLIPGYGDYNLMKRIGRIIGNASEG